MRKFLHLLLALCLAGLFVCCDKNSIDSSILSPDQVREKVYYAGSIPPYIKDALKHYMPYTTSNIADAKVVVGRSADLLAYKAELADLWKAGGITLEIHPEFAAHDELWDYIGPGAFLPEDRDKEDFLLIAVHNYGSYRVSNPMNLDDHLQDLEAEDDELASPSDEVFEDEDTNEVVSIEATSEYIKTKLESFAAWMAKNLSSQGVQASEMVNTNAEVIDKIDQLIHRDECSQIEKGTLNIGADNYQLCKIASSKPDKISRHSTYDYEITITPFYAFAQNGKNAADYYFITAQFVSHNYPLFGTYKKRHGAIPTVAHAFYSENINWEARLETGNNSKYKVSFPEVPTPTTTVGQMKYTHGFSATLNVTGQIGFTGPAPTGMLTVGGTFTWNNATDITLNDQTINMSYSNKTGKVKHEYKGLNHLKNDNAEQAVPQILKSSQVCTASWYWKVDGVSDNETTQFTMKFKTDPLYGYMYRHCTWGAEGHLKHDVHLLPQNDTVISITVKCPNRTPTGIIEMECTSKYNIRNVKVYDVKDTSKPKATSDGSYKKNFLLRYQLPAGTYYITFDIYNPDAPNKADRFLGSYKYSGIQVTKGKTTGIQSDDADKTK